MTSGGKFFDRHAAAYHARRGGLRRVHRLTAQRMEASLRGSVLSVGGLWSDATLDPSRFSVTVGDISVGMLREQHAAVTKVACDATAIPFRASSYDSIVFPLVLHHVAGRSVAEARDCLAFVLDQARSILRPGGTIWISELCVSAAVYAIERAAAPATRTALRALGSPLIVVHPRRVFLDALAGAGFRDLNAETIAAPDAKPTDLVTPIIALPMLKVPRFLHPMTPVLFSGRK